MKKETKMFLCGCAVMAAFFLFCSWTYNVNKNMTTVDVRTINEGGHSYVVTTASNKTGSSCSVAIVHSEACSCKR